jgi:adenylate cyclase
MGGDEMGDVERRLAAILSADAAGYTRLMAEDELATLRTLTEYRELLGELVHRHGGRVVDSPGDNLLAEFPSVVEAVRCAAEAQRDLEVRNAALPQGRRMPFRMGVHVGEVLVENGRIYGDGVNIAARLEALGEAGGLCLSAAAHDQVEGKVELCFEDLGERALKNVPRPIRVYQLAAASPAPEPSAHTVPGFAGRPAVAVLAFDNLSDDPEQEYFADGIAEDLITRLSGFRWFPVIARNSSFTYKGQAVDVKRVSEELGVRYVVEGSVRKAGQRVRITAQLIDATTGHHVWAERYDRELRDIFEVQDEVAATIAAAISPELRRADSERSLRSRPENLEAWDRFMRGMWHMPRVMSRYSREDNRKARELFESAAAGDPGFAPARFGMALTHLQDALNRWSDSPSASIARALELTTKAVELDPRDAFAHHGLGLSLLLSGQTERAAQAFRHALELDPSLAVPNFGLGLATHRLGHTDEACRLIERAARLSPRDPLASFFWHILAILHFARERYPEAAGCARSALDLDPINPRATRILAAALAELGQVEEARRVFASSQAAGPELDVEQLRHSAALIALGEEPVERMIAALRKAGWSG